MSVEFRPFDFSKLDPYTGTKKIFWKPQPEPFEFSIRNNFLTYEDLKSQLTNYINRIKPICNNNLLSLSLYTIMGKRFNGALDPRQIVPATTPLEEIKWWRQLIKTIKFHNLNARETLPMIRIVHS